MQFCLRLRARRAIESIQCVKQAGISRSPGQTGVAQDSDEENDDAKLSKKKRKVSGLVPSWLLGVALTHFVIVSLAKANGRLLQAHSGQNTMCAVARPGGLDLQFWA